MADSAAQKAGLPPVRIHFQNNFPIETRGMTADEEPAVIEITNAEYSLEEKGGKYDVIFYVSGIKAFSITDDDQECFIRWRLYRYGTKDLLAEGSVGTGRIEMGERFTERECTAPGIMPGDYTFEIIYV